MEHQSLWAPWRIDYIKGLDDGGDTSTSGGGTSRGGGGCFLCDAADPAHDAAALAQRLVLLRDERGLLLLNRYPYTNGHLLVAPAEHVADLEEMTEQARAGMMELAAAGCRLLRATLNPQGANVGMNLGRCAGAGVPGHAHLHVVPRWNGDVNFMTVVAGVRILPQAIEATYAELAQSLRDEGVTR